MASLVVSESRRLVASLLILRQMKYISDFVVFQYYDSEIVKSYVRNSAIDIYDDGFPLIPEEIPLVLGITPIGGSPFGLVLRTEPVWLSMTESCARNMAFSQYSCILASRRFPLSLAQASQAAMTSSDCLVRVAISSWRLWRIAWCLFRDLAALCRFRSFLLRSMSSCSSSVIFLDIAEVVPLRSPIVFGIWTDFFSELEALAASEPSFTLLEASSLVESFLSDTLILVEPSLALLDASSLPVSSNGADDSPVLGSKLRHCSVSSFHPILGCSAVFLSILCAVFCCRSANCSTGGEDLTDLGDV
mmetsp:Transcript_14740/g.29972  ORF Transcript_14740/g.29972 Transcript_14740/m.29972 type:complete len:304 (-) Transcript_14740:383-1294(-)